MPAAEYGHKCKITPRVQRKDKYEKDSFASKERSYLLSQYQFSCAFVPNTRVPIPRIILTDKRISSQVYYLFTKLFCVFQVLFVLVQTCHIVKIDHNLHNYQPTTVPYYLAHRPYLLLIVLRTYHLNRNTYVSMLSIFIIYRPKFLWETFFLHCDFHGMYRQVYLILGLRIALAI